METRPGDLVLIHFRGEPMIYGRIEEITADMKPGWWQVRLIMLQVPAREVTWILRDEYIDGAEFTMGGDKVILEPVPPPGQAEALDALAPDQDDSDDEAAPSQGPAKVVSLDRRRKGGNGPERR